MKNQNKLTFRVLVAQSTFTHIRQLNCTLRACIHEPVAALWMELGSCYNFCELFHVCWLDINNVEALILNVQVPEIDSKIVTANESLSVTIDGYAINVISVRICVRLARYSGNDSIMVSQSWELEVGSGSEMYIGISHRTACTCDTPTRCELM